MKRLPIYGLLASGYGVIFWGISKFIKDLNPIQTVTLETQHTAIKFAPLIFISLFIFLISIGLGTYIITECWKYLVAHKTILPLPFLLIAVGFIQLMITMLNSINTMIKSNADMFIANNQIYIKSLMTLNTYTVVGIVLIVLSVGYSVYLKVTA